MHSQLKIKYPNSPFVWNYNDMKQLYSANFKRIDKDTLFYQIIDTMTNNSENILRNPWTDKNIIDILVKMTNEEKVSNVYEKIEYVTMEQKIPNDLTNMWINFHTSVLCDDNNSYLNKESVKDIAWCLIPVIGNIESKKKKYTFKNIDSNTKIENNNINYEKLDPVTYQLNDIRQNIFDVGNKYDRIEDNVKTLRTGKRNFIKRDEEIIEKNKNEVDNYIDIKVKPKFEQIELNNNTRACAHLIRDRLKSSYKMNRLRCNPELLKQQMRIDLSLKDISQTVADHFNEKNTTKDIEVSQDYFDFNFEQINVERINGILRFGPHTTGRANIKRINNEKFMYFITVLRYKTNLHITFHCLEFM